MGQWTWNHMANNATHKFEIYKEAGVLSGLGQVGQEHSHTQHQNEVVLANLTQSLQQHIHH